MSQAAVEQVIGKLLIDADFRKALSANAGQTLSAFDLTAEERETLAQIDTASVEAAAGELDPRISQMTIRPLVDRLVVKRIS